jgi:methionyl aminopeptidase
MTITIKDAPGIEAMRTACRLAAEVLDYLTPFVKPGVTTRHIDELAGAYMRDVQGTSSATLGYQPPGYPPYPASLCTSLNHVVCHGIPSDKPMKKGDILNIDVTVIKDGWFGDTSRMYVVGDASIAAKRLVNITYEALWHGITCVRPGATFGDIGSAIQKFAEGQGFSVVREFCGHGIGRSFHEDPQVLHYGKAGTGVPLQPGMTFTIEPMLNAGRREVKELGNDGWTIVTKDHSLSAQWEHTVLVTDSGYEVLTLSAGSPPIPLFVSSGAVGSGMPTATVASQPVA